MSAVADQDGGRDRIARRIHVQGKVQGVFFRAWTVEQATGLGLDGWVRNRHDGSVEAVAVGPADKVEELIARCRRGSPASTVEAVTVEDMPGIVDPGFSQKPTL
ncbi:MULTISPECIES: acylphosphatase [unclassified Sphingomonas]|uniref:acylphosphatase n=1 Tax=unclassified Sphingomonas TaxID=196159 RepID=UPI0007004C52|nr:MULTISPECIES: acylphosphatase [unclassified Sphingomonas]KQX19433.1 acylphosphatase [Sphingomonas sp. Root1294]KQY65634.1 acylphosphatase [Sphingomonas sp. Root50]KRB95062.1 acylphosphatase [Sphingomonas sp. Root720]